MSYSVKAKLTVVVALVLLGEPAWAQSRAESGLHFDLQPFHQAPSAGGLVLIDGADIARHLRPRFAAALNYQRRPLIYRGFGETVDAIADRLEGEIFASIGFVNRIELALSLPLVFYQTGEAAPLAEEAEAGLGDLQLAAKLRLLSHEGLTLALSLGGRLPTGGDRALAGSGWAVEPRLLLAQRMAGWSVHALAGYRAQPARRLLSLVVDDQLLFGTGLAIDATRRVRLITEVVVAMAASAPLQDSQRTPVLALGGIRYFFGNMVLTAAAGPGLVPGHGAPLMQASLTLAFDPAGIDRDGDMVRDRYDSCPMTPEDRDGHDDRDGCPDPDDDHDGLLDGDDSCRERPEDRDGFEDDDGCPDPDNDQDQIPDTQDQCPNEAEDDDGFEDLDGCPDPDNDGDGIEDAADRCPDQAEVVNGLDDDDGCPEADRDADGVLDDTDTCPGTPEDRDGNEDEDGCPEGPAAPEPSR